MCFIFRISFLDVVFLKSSQDHLLLIILLEQSQLHKDFPPLSEPTSICRPGWLWTGKHQMCLTPYAKQIDLLNCTLHKHLLENLLKIESFIGLKWERKTGYICLQKSAGHLFQLVSDFYYLFWLLMTRTYFPFV